MAWPLSYCFLASTLLVTAVADTEYVRAIYAQQDERVRLECTVSSRLDAEEAMWMRIRQPHNPDILTYRDNVVYTPERIQLEQRRLSSSLNANEVLVDTYFLTLTLLRPNIEDEGRYVCSRGKNVFAEYDLSIIVPTQFEDDDRFNQHRSVLEGSTLELSCAATGRPSPWITWSYRTHDGRHISLGDGAGCNETVCELRLANYSRHDPSVIECVADNHKSTRISKVFHVDVHYPPQLITNVRTYTRSSSIDVVLECSSMSNPSATITWLDDTKHALTHSHVYDIRTINQSSTLSFSVFPHQHSPVVFYCRSENSAGSDEKMINISEFIQFDTIIIRETTTIPLSTSPVSEEKHVSKKHKTGRSTRARTRPSTTAETMTTIILSTSPIPSPSNSLISSSSTSALHFVFILLVRYFV